MSKKEITILCSGFGLGLYIPGLLLSKRLNQCGIPAKVHVFESLVAEDKKEKVLKSKKIYHKNFAVALMSTRISMDMRQSLDNNLVDQLLKVWEEEERQDFIVLSGHWLHVLDEYKVKSASGKINIDILYVDCDLPPSWQSLKTMKPDYNHNLQEVWLYDHKNQSIQYQIPITDRSPVPYSRREHRFLIHGGGWGMGTYQGKIPELEEAGISLDIVAYDICETIVKRDRNRYFMIDPAWSAWNKNKYDQYEFPPLSEIKAGEKPDYKSNEDCHYLFEITREAKAIIGKPGAGTMMDSLGAATPLIMLEPFGDHERKNAQLWEAAGFGISYEMWKDSGYSTEMLEVLHKNLIEKRELIDDLSLYFVAKTMEMSKK
ncbi:MAG: UDP-glucuronosyltransferase [Ruminiclostridium sp.]